ncbi:MAG TPA: HlyD family efflux transporter periplasmic adaptor subunit, partial [Gemmatimonadaceae bacterium]|nr:HlyD family efflux transporter periplasmic adaptor subunit [Gemmatimonadaceae bacterium]
PEEAETAETEAVQAEAHASALATIKGYELLRAPFDGVITARFADPGALVQNAQNAQTSSLPVVAVGTTDSLRIYVYVDQRDAGDVTRGSPVTIQDPSHASVTLTGTVSRFTGELDPQTRTLLAEIDVPNHKSVLVAGGIVQVTLDVHSSPFLHVPAAAVFANGTQNYIALVTSQNRVAVHEIHVMENDGEIIHFTSDSVRAGDRAALDLGRSVPDGQRVQPADEPATTPVG